MGSKAPWDEIVKKSIPETNFYAKKWCALLNAFDNPECILALQKLALTNQLDENVVNRVCTDKLKYS